MATIVCADGLAGLPTMTFGTLRTALIEAGHKALFVDMSHVETHEDRIGAVQKAYNQALALGEKVFLVGQSAGGSAVRVVAEDLCQVTGGHSGEHLQGIIMLSPAVPSGQIFMTIPLCKVILRRAWDLLRGRMVNPTAEEYESLVAPLPERVREHVIESRQAVSGIEARTLAFSPPPLRKIGVPVLHIFGNKDTWIAPYAQRKLAKRMRKIEEESDAFVQSIEIDGAGHLTLASELEGEVIERIVRWIDGYMQQ